ETLYYLIVVSDNGVGISPKRLEEIRDGKRKSKENEDTSNGIGLGNVIERLELYYQQKDLFLIESDGINLGTTVTIQIPKEGRRWNV
ncbi:MAG TPA: ATP-binding protein, partial [Lachnospiraceae bacterium]|nr:ATP-binding protein [Lachnospiraceae bacterium]